MQKLILSLLLSISIQSFAQLPPIRAWYQDSLSNNTSIKERYELDKDSSTVHGIYVSYYSDGKLKAKGRYKHGVANGGFEENICIFPPSTSLTYKRSYQMKNGQLHGTYIETSRKGSLLVEGNFRNGEKHGKWVIHRVDFMSNYSCEGYYRKGIRVGEWMNLKYLTKEESKVGVDVGLINIQKTEPYSTIDSEGFISFFSKKGEFINCTRF